jgi:hypothetical protein
LQCATLNQLWQTQCQLTSKDDSASKLGGQIAAGNDPDASKLPTPGNGDSFNIGDSIKQDKWLAASCPASKSYNIVGRTFTINFSDMCNWLSYLGNVGVAISLLVAAFYLFR